MSAKLVLDQGTAIARAEPLVEAAKMYVAAARSERTREEYTKQWRRFCAWCAEHEVEPLPAEPTTVVLFITALAEKPLSVSTIEQALAAISQAHQLAGHPSPRLDSLVGEVGSRHERPVAARARRSSRQMRRSAK